MRLLHTSDWHIGIKLQNFDYLPSQKEFAEWLLETVKSEDIDAVLISGDIFDRSLPSEESLKFADEVFVTLLSAGVKVVVISGNHDSADRLNFCSKAMENAGLFIRTEKANIAEIGEPIEIKKGNESVFVIPIPYLDPTRVTEIGEAERSHGGLIAEILKQRASEVPDPSKTIVMSHCFAAGGTETESERKLTIGGTARVAKDVFKGFGYVALGHLHRPQVIGGENIYYSGTPLQYSFSEEHQKSVRIIDVGETIESQVLEIPVGPKVKTLIDTFNNLLSDKKYAEFKHHLVRIKLLDEDYVLNAWDQLSSRFKDLVGISYEFNQEAVDFTGTITELTKVRPDEIVRQYMEAVHPHILESELEEFVNESVKKVMSGGNK